MTSRCFAPGDRSFRAERFDQRSGTIHVPSVDINGDGRMDFLALISQEHETIVAFLNTPSGFEKSTVFAAGDPAFGSSGVELCDFDGDGDQDVLYTNGDTFDSFQLKPYHGVYWLENEGRFPFRAHFLTAMPGAHRALPADFDGDGDIDVVAALWFPSSCAIPRKCLWTRSSGWNRLNRAGSHVM